MYTILPPLGENQKGGHSGRSVYLKNIGRTDVACSENILLQKNLSVSAPKSPKGGLLWLQGNACFTKSLPDPSPAGSFPQARKPVNRAGFILKINQ